MHSHWNFAGRGHGGGRHGHGPFGGRGGGFMGRMGGGHGFRAARMLASDDLQLIILSLLNEKPRHGYEIIKSLEEHSGGSYTPSPGVVYPALTYVEEMGYAKSEAEGNKKLFQITEEGKQHLEKNQAVVAEMLEHLELMGKRMAKMQKFFNGEQQDEDGDDRDGRPLEKDERRAMKLVFGALRNELKAALREKIDASLEEKKRVQEILKRAIEEIRGK